MQIQDKAKRTQAKHAEWVERSCKQLPVLFLQRIAMQKKSMQMKYELIELSNVIIYVVRAD